MSTMNIIPINLTFYRLPMLPKESAIYWCILKWDDQLNEKLTYHYMYVGFENGYFDTGSKDLEVMAWCELENPEQYFKEKKLIITR